jgi:hypothetical protein
MVERSLRMREARGSIPRTSSSFLLRFCYLYAVLGPQCIFPNGTQRQVSRSNSPGSKFVSRCPLAFPKMTECL